jgi:uncharacterized RDD family membrane protein YckC
MNSASASQGEIIEPAYARFWPRVRALYIDVIVLTVVMAAALVIAVSLKMDSVARLLGFTVAAFWLLYEPLLVSFAGGTIGHRRTNLRIVDNRTHGNVSFLKAVARVIHQVRARVGLFHYDADDTPLAGGPRPVDAVDRADPRSGFGGPAALHPRAAGVRG